MPVNPTVAIDLDRAALVFEKAAAEAAPETVDKTWLERVQKISHMCEAANMRTHIAFLGTALLAKSTDLTIDVFAIKATKHRGAYSARTLCHNVLVPRAAGLGIHLGVTGREPLNNMPYFRMERLDDGTRIHANARPIFEAVKEFARVLAAVKSEAEAQAALKAFIVVRREYQPLYALLAGQYKITPEELSRVITTFVSESSEGGRRAQAVVAGLLDVFAGPDRVACGRINDPSRHYPGDVAIRSSENGDSWEKAFEVRDKIVSLSDAHLFGQRCLDLGVREGAIVAVARAQMPLPVEHLLSWADERGMGMVIYDGWPPFVQQALFWSERPSPIAASEAVSFIHERLISIEVSPAGVLRWIEFVAPYLRPQ